MSSVFGVDVANANEYHQTLEQRLHQRECKEFNCLSMDTIRHQINHVSQTFDALNNSFMSGVLRHIYTLVACVSSFFVFFM